MRGEMKIVKIRNGNSIVVCKDKIEILIENKGQLSLGRGAKICLIKALIDSLCENDTKAFSDIAEYSAGEIK